MNQNKMLGKTIQRGPGGRYCTCCGEPPRHAKRVRRATKRSERNQWKKDVR